MKKLFITLFAVALTSTVSLAKESNDVVQEALETDSKISDLEIQKDELQQELDITLREIKIRKQGLQFAKEHLGSIHGRSVGSTV